jgi:hypothetical protein
MTTENSTPPATPEFFGSSDGGFSHLISVADQTLASRPVAIGDATPTGTQIARAAGMAPAPNVVVMALSADGQLELVRPDEVVDLRQVNRFVVVESDRLYLLTINVERFEWPCRVISGGAVRKLGRVPADEEILFDREDRKDRVIGDADLVDLEHQGVEAFHSRKRNWKLNVQGVVLDLTQPTIAVGDAMTKAGFDVKARWYIFLKVEGQPKKEVTLDYVVDLRTPGIEKIRLTPRGIDNGEGAPPPRRDFALLERDEIYLNDLGLRWETVVDAQRRWLLIHDYPVLAGYTIGKTCLALEIPLTYPGAQIDMFYAYPPLALKSGRAIDRTQVRATILGLEFHGWSRHRNASAPWDAAHDCVATHLALVESAIAKEVGL